MAHLKYFLKINIYHVKIIYGEFKFLLIRHNKSKIVVKWTLVKWNLVKWVTFNLTISCFFFF